MFRLVKVSNLSSLSSFQSSFPELQIFSTFDQIPACGCKQDLGPSRGQSEAGVQSERRGELPDKPDEDRLWGADCGGRDGQRLGGGTDAWYDKEPARPEYAGQEHQADADQHHLLQGRVETPVCLKDDREI